MKAGPKDDHKQFAVTQADLQAIQQRRIEEAAFQDRVAQNGLDHVAKVGPTVAAAFRALEKRD